MSGTTNSTGGLGMQIYSPTGSVVYSTPWAPWDSGQTIVVTVSPPVLLPTTTALTSSANPSVFGQSDIFTASVGSSAATTPSAER